MVSRNFLKTNYAVTPEEMMLDKAQLLGLTAPEMTVLVGGLRTLGVSSDDRGLFSNDNSNLSNDYFTTLLDMGVKWKPTGSNSYEGVDRSTERFFEEHQELIWSSVVILS